MKAAAWILGGLLLHSASSQAAGKLGEFAGRFNKGGAAVWTSGSLSYSGPVNALRFAVKRNGRGGTLTCDASVVYPTPPPPSYSIANVFRFQGPNMGIAYSAPPNVVLPSSGMSKVKKNRIVGGGEISPDPGATWTFEARIVKSKRKATLFVTYVIFASGKEVYRYTYKASRRIKKSEQAGG